MRQIVTLGAGTAGTVMANRLGRLFKRDIAARRAQITVVDQEPRHVYQPGLLLLPFGVYTPEQVVKDRVPLLPKNVRYVQSAIERLDPATDTVTLANGETLAYDVCIIATGTRIAPEETEGMLGEGWQRTVFDFYTYDGSVALAKALEGFTAGRLVINVVEMPIKCPVAPLEFAFLADWYFSQRGVRDKIEIVYATPLDGAFTKPIASQALLHLLKEKRIHVETEFNAGSVDGAAGRLVSWDDRVVPFDLLVTIPLHKGAAFIERSPGLGDDMGFVLTDPHTLQAAVKPNIFAIGDATNVPTSKAGSVAHFEAEGLAPNIVRFLEGLPLAKEFDGHANCFIETGFGKALLIDFNYDTEPLLGKFPLAIGPMSLLKESRINHFGKMAFRHFYWNALLPGYSFPGISPRMTMTGKVRPREAPAAV